MKFQWLYHHWERIKIFGADKTFSLVLLLNHKTEQGNHYWTKQKHYTAALWKLSLPVEHGLFKKMIPFSQRNMRITKLKKIFYKINSSIYKILWKIIYIKKDYFFFFFECVLFKWISKLLGLTDKIGKLILQQQQKLTPPKIPSLSLNNNASFPSLMKPLPP